MTTIKHVKRTPHKAFEGIVGWRWGAPSFFTSRLFDAEVRMAYWDLGPKHAKEAVLLTHGEPSWSYLNRRMIDPLLEKGHRVVLFDQVGFGWSDKPADPENYTYERHVAWNEDLLCHHLDLHGLTAVFQDWGGLLGLRVAARSPHRFSRLVLSNTVLPTCDKDFEGDYVSSGFYNWKKFVHSGGLKGSGKVGSLFSRAAVGPSCGPAGQLSAEDLLAYQAPFPDDSYLAGAQQFPELVPTPPDDMTGRPQPEGGEVNRAMWHVYENWTKPVLLAFGNADPVLGEGFKMFEEKCPGAKGQSHLTLNGGGHFTQDGAGVQLVNAIISFIESSSTTATASKL